MAFPVLVVHRGALLDDFQQGLRVQDVVRPAQVKDAFHQVDEVAAVAVRQVHQGGAGFRCERQLPLEKGFRPFNDAVQRCGVQSVHDEDLAA